MTLVNDKLNVLSLGSHAYASHALPNQVLHGCLVGQWKAKTPDRTASTLAAVESVKTITLPYKTCNA